jgi:hypothetical protein
MPSIIIDGSAGGAFSDQPGSDQITFGVAAATLTAGQGVDTVLGGAGQLLIDASADSNPISIQGGGGQLVYTGGPGTAAIAAGLSPTTILTGNGAISVVAGGQVLDVYSSDAWSGYYEFTPAAGDAISIAFNGSADDVVVTDHSTGSTVVVGQGFAYNQADPGTLLAWNEPGVAIVGLTAETGSSAGGLTTTNSTPVLTGTAPALSAVTVTTSAGVALSQPVVADALGNWQAALTQLPLGETDLVAHAAIDSALPPFEMSEVAALQIVPSAPSVVGFTDGSGLQTGSGATFDLQPEIDGATQAGTTVQVFNGSTLLGDAAVTGTAWAYDPAADLPEGAYTLTAVASDPASGAVSAASAPITLDVSLAPPTVDGFTDGSGYETGGATPDHQPALSGTTPDGAAVSVYENGALIGSAVTTGTAWSFTPTADLADGADSITAVATDPATGTSSAASAPLVFTVEPSPPELAALTGASGAYQSGATVADLSLTLSGTADPGTDVTVSDAGTVLGQAVLTGSTWTYDLPAGLAYGPHALTAIDTDPSDGDVSAPSAELDFTFAPPSPIVSGVASSTDGVTSDADPAIVGTAVAGDLVSVYDGATLLGSATADGSGDWQLTPAAALAYGAHVLTATDTAADGSATSLASQADTITILAPPPLITMLDGAGTGQPLQAWVTADADFTLSGTSLPGYTINLYDGSTLVGQSSAVGSDGAWSATLGAGLSAGAHVLTATEYDSSGQVSEPSAALSVIVNPPPAASAGASPFGAAIQAAIAALVGNGVIYPQAGQPVPALPAGDVAGLSVDDTMSGQTVSVPGGTSFVSDIASGPVTVFGGSGAQAAVATNGGLTYVAGTGSGLLLADQSQGDVTFFGSSSGSSSFAAATGPGDDVFVVDAGAASLSGGAGANVFWLNGGSSTVDSSGVDTVIAGAGDETVTGGAETISAAPHSDFIFGGAGRLDFINLTGGSTVAAGSGSSTLLGGAGSALFFGGRAGGNVMVSGDATSTLVGGGSGDLIFAEGAGDDVLAATGDNTTLDGGSSTGSNLYFGGAGRNVIAAGLGDDTISGGAGSSTIFAGAGQDLVFGAAGGGDIAAGTGNATLAGAGGAELYAFFDGRAGGDVVIYNYRPGVDHLTLNGYTEQSISTSLQSETVQAGSTHLLLSDGTRITFVGVSDFTASNLV